MSTRYLVRGHSPGPASPIPATAAVPAASASLAWLALALAATTLTGCGDSDLETLHEMALDDALLAVEIDPPVLLPELRADGRPVDLSGYELAFGDEFRALELDETRWNTALPWGPDVIVNGELQRYVDTLGEPAVAYGPFSFDGETLLVRAVETPESSRASANEQPWLSGALTSAGRFESTFGYVEARVDPPEGRGVSTGFWMLAADDVGSSPQVSVMRHDGAKPGLVDHDYEFVDREGDTRSYGPLTVGGAGISDGFHTFGVLWSPGELLFFVDGEARYRIADANVPDQAMYLVLALAIGGTGIGAPDATTPRPVEWVVDHVRVWQKR